MMTAREYASHMAGFDWDWIVQAEDGLCDEPHGAQHNRVWLAWLKAGCPEDIPAFIRREANHPAPSG